MYKVATDLSQRRARQLWLADLQGPDFDALSPEEQRASLVQVVKSLQAQVLKAKGVERRALGVRVSEVCAQINALRPKRKGPPTTPQFFVDVCRERLPSGQFRALWNEANELASRAAEQRAEGATSAVGSDDHSDEAVTAEGNQTPP